MQRYSKDPLVDRSLRHSVRDGVAYSVMSGGGETYFSAFALHLNASTAQVGLLASLPPLVGSLAQLISAWLGRRTGNRRAIILGGVGFQIGLWIPIILLPLLFPELAVPLFIGCVVLYHAMANLVAPQWSSLMADLVPVRRRGRFFANRTRLASVTAFSALVVAGVMLHRFDAAGNAFAGFITLFAVAAAARCVSLWHLTRMHDPSGKVAALEAVPHGPLWRRLRRSSIAHFSLFFALMQFCVSLAGPFFTVYMLRDLHYTYVQFMANTATTVLVQFLTLNMWGRLSDAFGNRLVLVVTGGLIPMLPALWLVSTDFWYLLTVQALGGLMWAGFSLGTSNFLYDLLPANNRVTYLAYHSMLANLGAFGGALLGGWLGASLSPSFSIGPLAMEWSSPLLVVFLISALARLLVVALFVPRIREVRRVRKVTLSRLVFRVARFNALSGLVFEIVGRMRGKPGRYSARGARVEKEGIGCSES